jgi:hypothetical protein
VQQTKTPEFWANLQTGDQLQLRVAVTGDAGLPSGLRGVYVKIAEFANSVTLSIGNVPLVDVETLVTTALIIRIW